MISVSLSISLFLSLSIYIYIYILSLPKEKKQDKFKTSPDVGGKDSDTEVGKGQMGSALRNQTVFEHLWLSLQVLSPYY